MSNGFKFKGTIAAERIKSKLIEAVESCGELESLMGTVGPLAAHTMAYACADMAVEMYMDAVDRPHPDESLFKTAKFKGHPFSTGVLQQIVDEMLCIISSRKSVDEFRDMCEGLDNQVGWNELWPVLARAADKTWDMYARAGLVEGRRASVKEERENERSIDE